MFPTLLHINSFTFVLIPVVAICWFVLYKTVFGLRLRTVGENPEAADTLGINVHSLRYVGVIMSGVMCGLAAMVLYPSKWVNGMTGGRGYIALAALIFGRWHPVYAVLAALLFGYADTFRIMFESQHPYPQPVRADAALRAGHRGAGGGEGAGTVLRVCLSLVIISGCIFINLSNSILSVRINFILPHRVLSKRYSSNEIIGYSSPLISKILLPERK